MAYARTKEFIVDYQRVVGTSGSFSNFPFLILGTYAGSGLDPDFRTVANGGHIQNTTTGGASGSVTIPADLAFFNDEAGTTQFDHEVVNYDATSGLVEIRVRIPTLSRIRNTSVWAHYDDNGVSTSQENIGGVWEANYKAAYHLSEPTAPTNSRYDSSGNNNTLSESVSQTPRVDAKVGGGVDLERDSTQYLFIEDGNQTGLDITGNISVMSWVNLEQLGSQVGQVMTLISKDKASDERSWTVQIGTDEKLTFFYVNSTNNGNVITTDNTFFEAGDVGSWVHVAVAADITNSTATIYRNGVPQDSTASSDSITDIRNSTAEFRIGSQFQANNFRNLDGIVDQSYVYSGLLSGDYIRTLYNNESDPSTFYGVGELNNENWFVFGDEGFVN